MAPDFVVRNDVPLLDLRDQRFKGAIADGALSSGQAFEIKLSDKSAVRDGVHLIISFPGAEALTPAEEAESFAIINAFARQQPMAQEFGYTFSQNFGAMLNRPQPHAHAIIHGSDAEAGAGPALPSPNKFAEAIVEGRLASDREYRLGLMDAPGLEEGANLVMTFREVAPLSADEAAEAFALILEHAREIPAASQFGFRYTQRFGNSDASEPYATIPGSTDDKGRMARIVDPWQPPTEAA